MPMYEYRCGKCGEKFSALVRSPSTASSPACPSCGGCEVNRLMSTFAYHRSARSIQEESGDPTLVPKPGFYNDPRNIGRWTEKRFKQLGLDVPPEICKEIEIAREGESPKSESDMLGI